MPRRQPDKRTLNALLIARMKPRATAYLVWDTKAPGLCIRVEPTGHRSWKYIYSRQGRPRWYSIGRVDKIPLADARKLAGRLSVRVADGADPQAERKADRVSGTFEDLAARYRDYAQHKKKNNKSWQQPDKLVKKHLLPRWGKLKVTDIKRSDVKAMMNGIAAPILANQTLAAASAIFTWGIREELIGSGFVHPCVGVERNATKERERILSDSELPLFWSAFDDAGMVEGMALKMVLLTGARPGEVACMRTEHIKDNAWWELPGEPVPKLGWPGTKNSKSNRVWLSEPAQDIVRQMDETGLVFKNTRGGPVAGMDTTMRAICKKLGVERATPHDLRRTAGSTITGLGFGRDAMDRILNHVAKSVTDVYDRHAYAKEDRHIMESIAHKIMTLIGGGAGAETNVISMPTSGTKRP
jgi:integrase